MSTTATAGLSTALKAALSKLAALAVLAVVVTGVVVWVLQPIAGRLFEAQDQIEDRRVLLGRLIAKAKDNVAVINQQPKNSDAAGERNFLPGENDSIRISGLQSVLNTAARSAHIRLASTRTMDPSERSGVRLLGVQTQLSTDLEPLQQLLFNLEKQQPNLLVDTLHIARSPQAPGQGLPSLDVTLSVYGAAPAAKDAGAKEPAAKDQP